MKRLTKAIKTVMRLGLKQTGLFVLYQFGLRIGHYQRVFSQDISVPDGVDFQPLLPVPSREDLLALIGKDGLSALLVEADAVVNETKFRQFGGDFVPIMLKPPVTGVLQDWTAYETGKARVETEDIKFVWEAARFGWAVSLARAYHLTGESKYAEKFWVLFEEFRQDNPYAKGPNWQSGQEVAIRMVTILLCAPVFLMNVRDSHSHQKALCQFFTEHASRILPTLVYARAQNNNHLVTEGLGLLCAGFALPDHPQAKNWRERGQFWLNRAFLTQITETGEYIQYSMNYHRVMLQSAILVTAVMERNRKSWPIRTREKLAAATIWLAGEVNPASGHIANYGHNDGAYLFPFASGGFADYRPVVQAASTIFLQQPAFRSGPWDELSLWLGCTPSTPEIPAVDTNHSISTPVTRATLRAHTYHSRPGHADQNHVDLWWAGECVALDPGTYQYNADPPWDNQLMTTAVHNTIMIDGQDQMTRAGKFLWLDWSTGRVTKENDSKLVGIHNGYQSLGVIHKRSIELVEPLHWQIVDELVPMVANDSSQHRLQCHWLLRDWQWSVEAKKIKLHHDNRVVSVDISNQSGITPEIQVCRAGQVIYGEGQCIPQLGWYSPTYGVKQPALSFLYQITSQLPVRITNTWRFEER